MTGLKETLALKGIAKNRYGSRFRPFDPCSVNACSMLKQDFSSVFVSDRNRTTKLVTNRSADMSAPVISQRYFLSPRPSVMVKGFGKWWAGETFVVAGSCQRSAHVPGER